MARRKDRSRPSFEIQDTDETPIEAKEIDPRDPSVRYLGMPDSEACRIISFPGSEKWADYRYEGVGVIVPDLPPPGVPCFVWEWGEIIVLWRRRVYHCATELYLEGLYHPTRGDDIHIPHIQLDQRPDIVATLARGLGLLHDVEARGSKSWHDRAAAEVFKRELSAAYWEFVETHERRPTKTEVALALYLSGRTSLDYKLGQFSKFGVTYPPLRG